MLAKLMATLRASMAPAATRNTVISAWAPRRRASRMGALVLRRGDAHHLQHVVHRRLILGDLVGDRGEQRLHFCQILGGKRMHGAAEPLPLLRQLLVEVELPALRLALDRGA